MKTYGQNPTIRFNTPQILTQQSFTSLRARGIRFLYSLRKKSHAIERVERRWLYAAAELAS
jgi:hypothetical protein